MVAPLLSFRLDPARRRAATAKALEPDPKAAAPEMLEKLGALLEPGQAIVAVLVEHVWSAALADAVARSGGHALTDDFVRLGDAADFDRRVLDISSRSGRGPTAPADRDR